MDIGHLTVSRDEGAVGTKAAQVPLDLRRWLYVVTLLSVIGLLAFVYVAQASLVARQIEEMSSLESDSRDLKQQNNAIILKIAQHEQFSRIQQEAQRLGFGEPVRVEYVEVPVDEASSSETEAGRSATPSSVSSPDEGWWPKVVSQFAHWIAGGGTDVEQAAAVTRSGR